jgi:hypothetical protein
METGVLWTCACLCSPPPEAVPFQNTYSLALAVVLSGRRPPHTSHLQDHETQTRSTCHAMPCHAMQYVQEIVCARPSTLQKIYAGDPSILPSLDQPLDAPRLLSDPLGGIGLQVCTLGLQPGITGGRAPLVPATLGCAPPPPPPTPPPPPHPRALPTRRDARHRQLPLPPPPLPHAGLPHGDLRQGHDWDSACCL